MIVECINDDFTINPSEVVKNMLLVGDDGLFPKKGQRYEVIGYADIPDENGDMVSCYQIDGVESSENYGVTLVFKKERFKIVDETFVPNHFHEIYGLCRQINLFMTIRFPNK